MKLGTTSHPKFRRLQRELKLPLYAVVGLLESVWMLAAQFAEDGDISRFSEQEIADYVGFEGDATHLVETLIACRWVDRSDQMLTIHDWLEHRPSYLNERDRKREKREKPNVFESPPGVSGNVPENPLASAPTKPSPTKPIPSQANSIPAPPSPTQPVDWAVRWSVGVVGKSFLDAVVETANRFSKLRKPLDRDLVWQACWIGCQFERDSINDACDKMKIPGEVTKPAQYLRSVMRNMCERNGEVWDQLRNKVPPPPPPTPKKVAVVDEVPE